MQILEGNGDGPSDWALYYPHERPGLTSQLPALASVQTWLLQLFKEQTDGNSLRLLFLFLSASQTIFFMVKSRFQTLQKHSELADNWERVTMGMGPTVVMHLLSFRMLVQGQGKNEEPNLLFSVTFPAVYPAAWAKLYKS